MSRFLATLAQRVLIFDGAMGTNIQRYQLTAEDYGGEATEGCNEYLVLTKPAVIEEIHAGFMEAGCDVLESDSFTASRLKLDEYGIGHLTHEINFTAAQLARRVADRYSTPEQPRFVAGSIGPTGMLPSSSDPLLSNITYQQLVEIFCEQATSLLQGGVDLLLIETSQDILEVRATITGIRRAMQIVGRTVPIQAQVSLDTSGRMLLGTDIAAVMTTLTALRVDIVGLNCSTGPDYMREPVRFLAENCPLPISTIPNAGIPLNVNGQAVYPMEPEPMAQALREFITEFGVNVIGGCCGNSHEHMRAIVQACRNAPRHPRPIADNNFEQKNFQLITPPFVSSGIRATAMQQDPAPLLVGERLNAVGSRKAKKALLADDYDTLLVIGREQVEGGAHVLDVQVATTERTDEAEQMATLVKKLSMGIEAPLVLDSTEADVLKAALEIAPGRVIINSINMESGRQRIENVIPLALEHGSSVIALTIDEIGMGKEANRKVEIAHKIYDICVNEYGLPPNALIFDPLTFTITTGQEELQTSAIETLNAITRIKADLPGVMTILGVSNVSFGLKQHARAVLNSVFLYHAVKAGLDMAIVNPTHITPYAEVDAEQRQLADDLLFNKSPDALTHFINYFEAHGPQKDDSTTKVDPTEGMQTAERIHWQILHRRKEGIEPLIDEVVSERATTQGVTRNEAAVNVLNTVLLPAMKDVGDRFGAGELILPFVLQSAEVMKRAVAHLEKYLEKQEGYTKGKVVLATVFGDVHDIGKNLVNTILSNNGYTVYDLGKQVPLNTILEKAIEVNADAIGLSALLVSTSKQMPLCVRELYKRKLDFPVIIGGAAINRSFGRRILFVDDQTPAATPLPYAPGVFYARDAFEGLDIIDKLTNTAETRTTLVQLVKQEALKERLKKAEKPVEVPSSDTKVYSTPSPSIHPALSIPTPPFWGPRVLDRIGLEDVAACLDLNALYRGRWGGKAHGAEFDRLVEQEFRPRLERMLREARQQRYLQPKLIYGYFPCQSSGNELIVYDPQKFQQPTSTLTELVRFNFPRQSERDRLCLADYFASVQSGKVDVAAFQLVTVGKAASEAIDRLQQAGNYSEAYFVHGLSVQMAEGLADYANRLVQRELGLEDPRGKRYSWGYSAIPDLEDHAKLFQLLPAKETIGVDLTEAFQFVPEQSTGAIVVHHQQASYFSVHSASAAEAASV